MNVVIPQLADIILKQLGVAGAEAISLTALIRSFWKKYADDYLDDFFKYVINLDTGVIHAGMIHAVWMKHQLTLSDAFIEKVVTSEDFDYYLEKSFLQGVKAIGVVNKSIFKKQTEDEILQEIVDLTGTTLANAKRTVKRWFEETQGRYFDRFIKGETDRLFLSVGDVSEDLISMRKLGERYKQFVEADGYWSSIGGFDANTTKIFGEVESMHQQQVQGYVIKAFFTAGTCPVCEHMDGSTWYVDEALSEIDDLVMIGAGEDPRVFNPWPDRSIVQTYPNPQDSPYRLPPFHLNCNCDVYPI